MPNDKCKMLMTLTVEQRAKFKTWSRQQGVTMNTAFAALVETVTSRKPYKIQQRVLELKQ